MKEALIKKILAAKTAKGNYRPKCCMVMGKK